MVGLLCLTMGLRSYKEGRESLRKAFSNVGPQRGPPPNPRTRENFNLGSKRDFAGVMKFKILRQELTMIL